jgi:hypothetical protein
MKRVVVYNDCWLRGDYEHFGCELVMECYREQLSRVGMQLVGSVTQKRRECWEAIKEMRPDLIIVNGEGSLHHGCRPDLIEVSHRFPSVLVNTVYQDNGSVDLSSFKYIAVRESASMKFMMRETGYAPDVVPDVIFSSQRVVQFLRQAKPVIRENLPPGYIRHHESSGEDNVVSVFQRASSFLIDVYRRGWVTTRSYHGLAVALMLGVPVRGVYTSNTHKLTGLSYDAALAEGDYCEQSHAAVDGMFNYISKLD